MSENSSKLGKIALLVVALGWFLFFFGLCTGMLWEIKKPPGIIDDQDPLWHLFGGIWMAGFFVCFLSSILGIAAFFRKGSGKLLPLVPIGCGCLPVLFVICGVALVAITGGV